MSDKPKAVIIVSGGMDSTTLLYQLKDRYDLYALSYHYGQRHRRELDFAVYNCYTLNVPNKLIVLPDLQGSALTGSFDVPEGHFEDPIMRQTVVPNRNSIMLSIAASYAIGIGAYSVFFGAHAGDYSVYPDCRKEYIDAFNEILRVGNYTSPIVYAPYLHMRKKDILQIGFEYGVPYDKTWTCYNGREKACGKCGACQERLEAFNALSIIDPMEYENV